MRYQGVVRAQVHVEDGAKSAAAPDGTAGDGAQVRVVFGGLCVLYVHFL